MSGTDAFDPAYGRLSATTLAPGGPTQQRPVPMSAASTEARPSRLLPRLASMRPKPARRKPAFRTD